MKRVQLIEWGIIVVGLVFGYKFFESIFSLIAQLVYGYDNDILDGKFFIRILLVTGMYFIGFVAIIRNSHVLATWLNGGAVNNTLPIKIGRRSALQIVLIAICSVQVFSGLAAILIYLYDSFQSNARPGGFDIDTGYTPGINKATFKLEGVKVVIALVAIAFSKDLANLFFRKNEPDELVLESKPVDEENSKPE
jgi:hypothetical protein